MTGRLFTLVGPSGAGKDTLLAAVRVARPDLAVVRRVITRPEAAGGEDFEGVTEAVFADRLAAGAFALHWQAHGLHYGIPMAELAPLDAARDVIFNGSRQALPLAQARFPGLTVILVSAPVPVLAERLAARGRECRADIEARLSRADFSLPAGIHARHVVNDGPLDQGVARFLAALQGESV